MHKYLFLLIFYCCAASHAADWKPDKPVELVVSVAAGGNQDITYKLEMIRAGLNMRLQTPGKTARFYGNFGGGYVWASLDFNYGGDTGLVDCLTPRVGAGIAPSCDDIDGSPGNQQ